MLGFYFGLGIGASASIAAPQGAEKGSGASIGAWVVPGGVRVWRGRCTRHFHHRSLALRTRQEPTWLSENEMTVAALLDGDESCLLQPQAIGPELGPTLNDPGVI
ncbi:hypothetical protein EJ04DRAFT_96364 [Polyplosphaeria fusca]|uniref:Uncharacterized protein n=1 Tax=Polyplosphaeria fusca TaxID=682080 RepID=A0A9P4UXU0_9PLEO|nr:hypothetical protein EJ04DRAFT_96364 [Polyplosphaeria fusca]